MNNMHVQELSTEDAATEKALENLLIGNPEFEAVVRELRKFCPFEAVGMVTQEIRHAHFLSYCLDPHRPHGFGSEPLRALMRAAATGGSDNPSLRREEFVSPLEVHTLDFDGAEIRREWRRIDLLAILQKEKLVVAIELKIRAQEHSGQLGRYREIVNEVWPKHDGWRRLLLFLSPEGSDVSDDGSGWLALSLAKVADELSVLVDRRIGDQNATCMLSAYIAMLKRNVMASSFLTELAAKIWGQHKEALEFLIENQPQATDTLRSVVFGCSEKILESIRSAAEMDAVVDNVSGRYLQIAFPKWDGLPDFRSARWTGSNRLLLLQIEAAEKPGRIAIYFQIGPADSDIRTRYFSALQGSGLKLSRKKEISREWTRLLSESIEVPEVDFIQHRERTVSQIIEKIGQYCKKYLPALDNALSTLRD